jgi:hypothetical protein
VAAKLPYEITEEHDPDSGQNVVVAGEKTPISRVLSVGVGSIIHFIRSSLDMVAASLARRNGVVPDRNTHFPIYDSITGFSDVKRGLDSEKCKKWLSDAERTTIKTLKPYRGGDETFWTLNKLGQLFKHERIVPARAQIIGSLMLGTARMTVGGTKVVRRMGKKTILLQLRPGEFSCASHGNTLLAIDIAFSEPGLGLNDESVVPILRKFAARVAEIVALFDI